MNSLKEIGHGRDNGGRTHTNIAELMVATVKEYSYFVSISTFDNPGALGGYVRWSVQATNNVEDLFEYLKNTSAEFYKVINFKILPMDKREVAKIKLDSMSEEELRELTKSMIIDWMTCE